MPKKSFTGLPYPPMVRLDRDIPIRPDDLKPLLDSRRTGVSLCVRSDAIDGAKQNRGGYFFHVAPLPQDQDGYFLTDFEKIPVTKADGTVIRFNISDLCEIINHCTGTHFSQRYLLLSQTEINFRSDPTQPDES